MCELLNIAPNHQISDNVAPGQRTSALGRFLMPISECSFQLETLFEDLLKDPWRVETGKRPVRTTGQAIQIASHLMEIALGRNGGRLLSFVGGPCTMGFNLILLLFFNNSLSFSSQINHQSLPYFFEFFSRTWTDCFLG